MRSSTKEDVPSFCWVCVEAKKSKESGDDVDEKEGGGCRFRGFRILSGPTPETCGYGPGLPVGSSTYLTAFEGVSSDAIRRIISALMPLMLEFVNTQEAHERIPGLIRRYPETTHRIICDICHWAILSSTHYCIKCAFEICCSCYRDQDNWRACTQGSTHNFKPMSRLPAGSLRAVQHNLARMGSGIASDDTARHRPAFAKYLASAAFPYRRIPVLDPGHEMDFRELWARHIPVLVKDVKIHGEWTPRRMAATHGQDIVTVVDTRNSLPSSETLASFLKMFIAMGEGKQDFSIKLKDYPPGEDFQEKLLDYYLQFQKSLPMRFFTAANALENLVAHWPQVQPGVVQSKSDCLKPDLGPKMYFATPDVKPRRQGSTKLHLDQTAAVNILVYSHKVPKGEDGEGAEWIIFSPEDTPVVDKFLREWFELASASSVPVLNHYVFLDDGMLSKLDSKYHVRPFRVHQLEGQAVFVPAGCLHQVSNNASCIKIAIDFLTVHDLEETRKVSQRLRECRETDVLRLPAVLWHAWHSLMQLREARFVDSVPGGRLRDQKSAARQRSYRAQKRSKNALEKPFRCVDPDCTASEVQRVRDRKFDLSGLFDHIKREHHVKVPRTGWDDFVIGSHEDRVTRYRALVEESTGI